MRAQDLVKRKKDYEMDYKYMLNLANNIVDLVEIADNYLKKNKET